MFSGGDYQEVARWLENFATSHARREDLRAECLLDTTGQRDGASYGLRVTVAGRPSSGIELPFAEVAAGRGSVVWCRSLADRVRSLVRDPAGHGTLKPA